MSVQRSAGGSPGLTISRTGNECRCFDQNRNTVRARPSILPCRSLSRGRTAFQAAGSAFTINDIVSIRILAGEPYPIHGNGFSLPWEVVEHRQGSTILRLDSAGPGPFRYSAILSYGVADGALTMSLAAENTGDLALPFGLGFHPWIVRTPLTMLQASAQLVWLEDEQHLPKGDAPIVIPPEWDFGKLTSLPDGWINNAFLKWDGTGEVWWPESGLRLRISVSTALSNYILYSPSREAAFFCFEPVSHPVDAFNLPGEPVSHGLAVLEPGERTQVSATWATVTANPQFS